MKVRISQLKTEHLLQLIRTSNNEEYFRHAINNIRETHSAIISDIELISKQIECDKL